MDSGEPLALWTLASTVLGAVDPRVISPFRGTDAEAVDRTTLMESLLGTELPETSALLAAIGRIVDDDLLRARIQRELGRRGAALPEFLRAKAGFGARRAMCMMDVLGDGQNVLVEVEDPSGSRFTCIVYVDHNLGFAAKDGFAVPLALDQMVAISREQGAAEEITIAEITLADARARLKDAIEHGAVMYPPLQTESWPGTRALIEAVLRALPDGGTGFGYREWSERELAQIAEAFLASPFGSRVSSRADRGQLELVLDYGAGYGAGDPLHWSPAVVEVLLTDWVPRKVMMPERELRRLPDVLRPFIRFCHAERAIPAKLTERTVAAVDRYATAFRQLISRPGGQDAGLLLAGIAALDSAGRLGPAGFAPSDSQESDSLAVDQPADDDDGDPAEVLRYLLWRTLQEQVGGAEELATLDVGALPDETFRWEGIADDVAATMTAILKVLDPRAQQIGGTEFRTACRRLLARTATGDPEVFRRRARADTTAAAICWISARANRLLSTKIGAFNATKLWQSFGVNPAAGRARTLMVAGGMDPDGDGLGSAELLTSGTRERIVERRDRLRREMRQS